MTAAEDLRDRILAAQTESEARDLQNEIRRFVTDLSPDHPDAIMLTEAGEFLAMGFRLY